MTPQFRSSQGTEKINNLISYQGHNKEGLILQSSQKTLNWIRLNYNSNCKDSIDWNSRNPGNLNCFGVDEFINERIKNSN